MSKKLRNELIRTVILLLLLAAAVAFVYWAQNQNAVNFVGKEI